MKLIHLSDLHIGKRVNGFSMIEDQKYILNQIASVIEEENPDGVILAGDIYDKPIPPTEAVQVLDGFLTELSRKNRAVFMISGNHDSPERLSFGSGLLCQQGVYVSPVYDGSCRKICLEDEYGRVSIHLLPYVKPSVVRHALEEESVDTYQAAVAAAIDRMEIDCRERNVLVAHQFVTGAARCESEEILVGGVDCIDVSDFNDFDYVALGHIHSPQRVGRETVRYCGTPLKYSFSEADQTKSVTVAELFEKGRVEIKTIPLIPLRDMRTIRGTYMEVTALENYRGTNTDDYVQITLTDEEDIPDGMQKLRVIYPHLMRLLYDNRRTRENQEIEAAEAVEEKSQLELLEEFYELQNNQPMSDVQKEFARNLISCIQEKEVHG